ncbi:MAG TPA: hypothetical protein VLM11_16605 [Streptosporangiaceae bacterium]|nr:hypothetical protein [Streptosporangiaceae bacterium]
MAEHWKTLGPAGKRGYLRAAGVKVHACRDQDGRLDAWITGPSPYKVIGVLTKMT